MKYLKTYENLNKPEIGDYILMIKKSWERKHIYQEFNNLVDFVNNTIGLIKHIKNDGDMNIYLVEYENMPNNINNWLDTASSRRDGLFYSLPERNTIRVTDNDNFVYGKNKNKLKEKKELKISTDNYNL